MVGPEHYYHYDKPLTTGDGVCCAGRLVWGGEWRCGCAAPADRCGSIPCRFLRRPVKVRGAGGSCDRHRHDGHKTHEEESMLVKLGSDYYAQEGPLHDPTYWYRVALPPAWSRPSASNVQQQRVRYASIEAVELGISACTSTNISTMLNTKGARVGAGYHRSFECLRVQAEQGHGSISPGRVSRCGSSGHTVSGNVMARPAFEVW